MSGIGASPIVDFYLTQLKQTRYLVGVDGNGAERRIKRVLARNPDALERHSMRRSKDYDPGDRIAPGPQPGISLCRHGAGINITRVRCYEYARAFARWHGDAVEQRVDIAAQFGRVGSVKHAGDGRGSGSDHEVFASASSAL